MTELPDLTAALVACALHDLLGQPRQRWVDELIVNGRTAQQASDDVAARLATRIVKEGAS